MLELASPPLPLVAEPIAGYAVGTKVNGWIEVLIDIPGVQELYTYNIPIDLTVRLGDILSVPFSDRLVSGIAVRSIASLPENLDRSRIKNVDDVIASGLFRDRYWELLFKIAEYYHTPLIQVIKAALPPGILARSQLRIRLLDTPTIDKSLGTAAKEILQLLQSQKDGEYSWRFIQQKVRGARRGLKELIDRQIVVSNFAMPRLQSVKLQMAVTVINDFIDASELSERQRQVLEILRDRGGEMWKAELLSLTKASASILDKLAEKNYVSLSMQERIRLDRERGITNPQTAPQLTSDQRGAIDELNRTDRFCQFLLHGVTGSGKTEVYLQIVDRVLRQGKSAIVLVPEIGLIPQITDRFRDRFGEDKICVYHSALSDGERYDTWRLLLSDTPQIIIGTRSAIFSPLPNLGIIILDEEHDSSYKQDRPAPTYHARDVARWRAELEACPLVLGSATPALETWIANANSPTYLSLPNRIESRPLPPIEVVDMRQELTAGNRSMFSRSLQSALRELQQTKKQGILFIHRRGHSSFVSCRSCGYVVECPHCDVSLAYHQPGTAADSLLRCHYCNHAQPQPKKCPQCDSHYFKFFGSGTQKVMEELAHQFPSLRCLRFDSDVTSRKGEHRRILTAFAQGEADILVGTQMLAKGLDLPQVTLVGVISADGLLHLSDYRAAERTFQTLTQVAGRCGRGADAGKVIVQTYNPEHPVLNAVIGHDYRSFIAGELPARQLLNYPPYGKLILLRTSSPDEKLVIETTEKIGVYLTERSIAGKYEVLGPATATVMRVSDLYRWQILLKYVPNLGFNLPDWEVIKGMCPSAVKLTIDVDPQNFL
jgi:primosomal protein N' (replication factor Y) (superfamily II helicase)